jgi:TadE-like protein
MSGTERGRVADTPGLVLSERRRGGWRDFSRCLGRLAGLRSDRGNAPLELVLIAPLILIMIGLVIAAGRVSTAQSAVNAAAREAARQASVAASEATAQQAAMTGATSALAADGLQCQPIVRLLNLSQAFNSPIGEPVDIRVRVTCDVQLSDLTVPGVPGSITLNAVFVSPLDPYRSRDLAALLPAQRRSGL